MSDVRAAAERLRQMRADSEAFDGGYPDNEDGRLQSLCDHAILADAYLAEHPADDDEPVTEDFIRSLNPPRYWEAGAEYVWPDVCLRYSLEICDGKPPVLSAGFYIDGGDKPVYLPHIKTRGDVRRLCRALGVEVKE